MATSIPPTAPGGARTLRLVTPGRRAGARTALPTAAASLFANLTPTQAQQLIRTPKDAHTNQRLYDGDHWLDGDGWIGPMPKEGTRGESGGVEDWNALVEENFCSSNKIREVVDRHRNGVVGRALRWAWVPQTWVDRPEEIPREMRTAMRDLDQVTANWAQDRQMRVILNRLVTTLLLKGRAVVALFVPEHFLEEVPADAEDASRGMVRVLRRPRSLDEALRMIHVHTPDVDEATVWEDEATAEKVGIRRYAEPSSDPVQRLNAYQPKSRTELTYVQNGMTVLRVISERQSARGARRTVASAEQEFDLGGRLLMFQMERESFITPQVRQLQYAYNLALTVMPKNVASTAFLERIFLNAQPPGQWVDVLDTNGLPTGRKAWQPGEYAAGPNTANWIQGTRVQRQDGTEDIKDPAVHVREPVGPDAAEAAKDAFYQCLLDEVFQSHVLLGSAATPNRPRLEHSRSDYLTSLENTAEQVSACARWMLETAVAWGEALLGQPGRYTGTMQCAVTPHLDTGPLSPDERRADNESVSKGTMSRSTAMERNGIIDPDSEMARIESERAVDPDMITKRMTALSTAVMAGAAMASAAEAAGFPPEVVATLVKDAAPTGAAKAKLDQQRADQQLEAQRLARQNGGAGGGNGRTPNGPPRSTTRSERGAERPRELARGGAQRNMGENPGGTPRTSS